ncbi:MAG: iron-sulfur cluster carrier protein ApbC [Granulosicoccaceae bacterium]
MSVDKAAVEQALAPYIEPHLECSLTEAKAVKSVQADGSAVQITLEFGFPCKSIHDDLGAKVKELVGALDGVESVFVNIETKIIPHSVQRSVQRLKNVKNIIAVASGKGGVGKSTTAANLALALAAEGAQVGILDADIYGPSQPRMMGITGKPDSADGKSLEPKTNYGVQTMSIGYMIEEDNPVVWRGPMVTGALQQMLNDTRWQDLDYLIVDMPPGTGDLQLTLSQAVPVAGSVIVTTPQDIALLDARKGLKMFEKVEIPVLGVIENMSIHICSQCGHAEHIFGADGGAKMAEQYKVDFLGALPLDMNIRVQADGGEPTVVADPNGQIAQIYGKIARSMTAKLSQRGRDFSGAFPKIVIEST